MITSRIISLGVLLLLTGCLQEPRRFPLLEAIQRRPIAAKVEVISIGEPPGAASGAYPTWQEVKYRILDVYKSDSKLNSEEVVKHVIVADSPSVDSKTFGLRKELVYPGRRMILFLQNGGLVKGLYTPTDAPDDVLYLETPNEKICCIIE